MASAGPAAQIADRDRLMPSNRLVVIGGGEHARVVIDAAVAVGRWDVGGFVDPNPAVRPMYPTDLRYFGDDEAFLDHVAKLDSDDRPWIVLGLGAPNDVSLRRRIAKRYEKVTQWATIVHPSAVVARSAQIGAGSVVLAGAILNPGVRLGKQVVINTAAVLEHDVVVDDLAQVAPGAVLGGGVRIGSGAFVGLGAVVRDHVQVGADAVVGMGSVVVRDVPTGTVVMGSPARSRGGGS